MKKKKINLEKKIPYKKIFKKNEMVVRIKEEKIPSVLEDTKRFFKNEMEEMKKSLFFK